MMLIAEHNCKGLRSRIYLHHDCFLEFWIARAGANPTQINLTRATWPPRETICAHCEAPDRHYLNGQWDQVDQFVSWELIEADAATALLVLDL